MFCTKCGKEFDDSDSFCSNCGAEKPSTAQSETQATPSPETLPPQVAYEIPGQPIITQPSAPQPIQMERKPSPATGIIIGVTVAIAIIAGLLIVFAVAIPVYNNARANAQRRTCQSNLRTVDGAIQTYEGMFDTPTFPDSLSTMVTGGANGETKVLKSEPTCPSGTAPYIWIDGDTATNTPPEISCPNNSTHRL